MGLILSTVPAVALMSTASAEAALLFRGSLQYLCEPCAQRETELTKLVEKYIQREEFIKTFEACFMNMQPQLTASRLDCKILRANNGDQANNQYAARKELSTFWAWAPDLETDLKAPRAISFDLTNAVRDRDCYKVLPQSLAAQVLGLHVGYFDIVSRAQSSQASICDRLGPLLKQLKPPFLVIFS